jgi:esterase/lipase superfamily enzyme
VVAVSLTGCGLRFQRAIVPTPQPAQIVEVFYATDRASSTPDSVTCKSGQTKLDAPRFANDRVEDGQLRFGLFSIQIPPERELGKLLRYVRRPICLKADHHPLYLKGPSSQPDEAFWQEVGARAAATGKHRILVFIHGFNFDFDEAVLWTALFKQDLEVEAAMILYSWPSMRSRFRYLADRASAEWSTPHLAGFLEELARRFPGADVHLVAHSMGTQALLDALHQISTRPRNAPLPRFREVVLAAADIDSWILRQRMPRVVPLAERITLYASAKDRALRASGRLHGYPRAGDFGNDPVFIPGVDTIDVTFVDRTRVGHNYYFDNRAVLADLNELLSNATPPEKRYGLVRISTDGGTLWQFRK